MKHTPPRWADKLLEWYCRPELLEDLQGDIREFYLRNIEKKGRLRANLNYIIDVVKFCRPYTVHELKLKRNMNQFNIFKNYVKTSIRNIARNKLFSLINVVGLAISMSVGLLIITFLTELSSYDTFHRDADRIYRLNNTYQDDKWDEEEYASTSPLAGKMVQEQAPGVEAAVVLRRFFNPDIQYEEKTIPAKGYWASKEFFAVFSFKLLQGNPELALQELNSLVLTETTARKVFGTEDALGKVVLVDTVEYTVTGIAQDPPKNSHLRFEVLGSFVTLENSYANNVRWMRWSNMWQYHVYFKASEFFDRTAFQGFMNRISEEENSKSEVVIVNTRLIPLLDIMPGKQVSNNIGLSMDQKLLWILSFLAFVVIISACFNYNNLSIARSLRRSLEIGIRKVIGASRFQIFIQFVVEAVIIALFALVLALPLFLLLREQFLLFDPNLKEMVSLEITNLVLIYFVLMAIGVGVLAGFFPALFFAKVNTSSALKDVNSIPVLRHFSIRKILIVFQYTLSIGFIVATTIAIKQYRYSLAFDLGFKTENILNLRLQGNKPQPVMAEMERIPEITGISKSRMVTSVGDIWSVKVKYLNKQDSVNLVHNEVDEHYIPILGHRIVAGRNFFRTSESEDKIDDQVIVNEELVKFYNMESPEEAIGEVLEVEDQAVTIVGVVKNFHYGKLDSPIKPFLFLFDPELPNYLSLQVTSNDLVGTMQKIDQAWKKVDKVHPLEATFYDDQLKEAYSNYEIMIKLSGFLAFLAISIASLGLLGMVVFTTESRLKEICVRKVLGANVLSLIYLIGKGFIILLMISALIAIPATYYFFDAIIFQDLIYKTPISLFELVGAAGIVMLIALIAILGEIMRASRVNPADLLRSE